MYSEIRVLGRLGIFDVFVSTRMLRPLEEATGFWIQSWDLLLSYRAL